MKHGWQYRLASAILFSIPYYYLITSNKVVVNLIGLNSSWINYFTTYLFPIAVIVVLGIVNDSGRVHLRQVLSDRRWRIVAITSMVLWLIFTATELLAGRYEMYSRHVHFFLLMIYVAAFLLLAKIGNARALLVSLTTVPLVLFSLLLVFTITQGVDITNLNNVMNLVAYYMVEVGGDTFLGIGNNTSNSWMIMFGAMAAMVMLDEYRKWKRIGLFLVIFIALLTLNFIKDGPFLALIACFGAAIVFRQTRLKGFLILGLGIVFGIYIFQEQILDWFYQAGNGRYIIWQIALETWRAGGARTIWLGLGDTGNAVFMGRSWDGRDVTFVHSAYLLLLYEQGLIGLILTLAGNLVIWWQWLKQIPIRMQYAFVGVWAGYFTALISDGSLMLKTTYLLIYCIVLVGFQSYLMGVKAAQPIDTPVSLPIRPELKKPMLQDQRV